MTNKSPVCGRLCEVIRGDSALEAIRSSRRLDPVYGNDKPTKRKYEPQSPPPLGTPDNLDDVLNRMKNHYSGVHSYAGAGSGGENYDLGDYLSSVENVQNYYENSGKELSDYLSDNGRSSYNVVGVATQELGNGAVAGVAVYGDDAALVLGSGFEQDVDKMVEHYRSRGIDVDRNAVERYVFDHENVHFYQKGIDFEAMAREYGLSSAEVAAEYDVENTLKDFYSNMALSAESAEDRSMYSALADIASDRAANVESNYSAGAESNCGGSYSQAA